MVSKNGGPGTCAGGGGWEQEDLQCQGWSWGWFRLEFSSPTAWDTFSFANDSCISIFYYVPNCHIVEKHASILWKNKLP